MILQIKGFKNHIMQNNAVDEVRRQIESLDEKIHDLLMKRAEVIKRLAGLREKADLPPHCPDRDMAQLSHLLARHHGEFPRESVMRIWREMTGAALMAADKRHAAVTVPDGPTGMIFWDMAKDYFGSVMPLHKVVNPLAALSMVRENEVAFAILPWPDDRDAQSWWRFLIDESGKQPMRIISRLPFGEYKSDNGNPEFKALVVARMDYQQTADDRAFIALQLEHSISRARIVDKAKAMGLTALSLYTTASSSMDYNDHLLEVTGMGPDVAVDRILKLLESDHGKAVMVGAYPVPPIYDAAPGDNVATIRKSA